LFSFSSLYILIKLQYNGMYVIEVFMPLNGRMHKYQIVLRLEDPFTLFCVYVCVSNQSMYSVCFILRSVVQHMVFVLSPHLVKFCLM
jgi:hypothetical protein